tara:strand:- start:343 stop:867 length:525 start_codon:yes stop_codon:yes gene_type:complete
MVCKICGQSGHYQKTCQKIRPKLPSDIFKNWVDLSVETLEYDPSVEIKNIDRKPKKRETNGKSGTWKKKGNVDDTNWVISIDTLNKCENESLKMELKKQAPTFRKLIYNTDEWKKYSDKYNMENGLKTGKNRAWGDGCKNLKLSKDEFICPSFKICLDIYMNLAKRESDRKCGR